MHIRARPARPPITPPTIAPTFVLDPPFVGAEEGVEVAVDVAVDGAIDNVAGEVTLEEAAMEEDVGSVPGRRRNPRLGDLIEEVRSVGHASLCICTGTLLTHSGSK